MKSSKKTLIETLIRGNKFVITCVVFVIATAIDCISCLIQGYEQTSFEHLISRFVICAIPIFSLFIFKHFEKLPLYIVLFFHYVITCAFVMAGVFVLSFFEELHPDAYVDYFRSFTMMYAIVYFGVVFIDFLRTFRANSELKKLNGNNSVKQ